MTCQIYPARYRKGYIVVQVPPSTDGFRTALGYACLELGGQWVHRYHGYLLPAKKEKLARRFLRLIEHRQQQKDKTQ